MHTLRNHGDGWIVFFKGGHRGESDNPRLSEYAVCGYDNYLDAACVVSWLNGGEKPPLDVILKAKWREWS